MRRLILCLPIVLSHGTAVGTLVEWDWQATNDGLITYDTETGLEWLDWTATTSHSYDDMIPKLEAGGAYHSFRYATLDETSTLFNHAGLGPPVAANNWYESPRTGKFGQLVDFLGETATTGQDRYSTAILSTTPDVAGLQHRLQVSDVYSGDYGRVEQSLYSVDKSQASPDIGHALVRSRYQPVPDAPAGTAEAMYDIATGEVFFDVGSGVAVLGIDCVGMFHENVRQNSIFGPPAANGGGIVAWFNASGLPVGEDSLGRILPAGLNSGDTGFSYTPIGGASTVRPVTMLPSIDFDGDDEFDVVDVNLLTGVGDLVVGVPVSPENVRFDLTRDGMVDLTDLDRWLEWAATASGYSSPYLKGDANLNGQVNVWRLDGSGDAQILSEHLGTASGAVWGDGDFNGDGDVDVWEFAGLGDAQLLATNLLNTNDVAATTVPEPSTLALLTICAVGMFGYGWRRRNAH